MIQPPNMQRPIIASGSLGKYSADPFSSMNNIQDASHYNFCNESYSGTSNMSHYQNLQQPMNAPSDPNSKPPCTVYVQTIKPRSMMDFDEEGNSLPVDHYYIDNITHCNMNQVCRRKGVPVPRGYWTNLWFVRDYAGWFGAGFTWVLIAVGEILAMTVLLTPPLSTFNLINAALSILGAFLGTVSHLRAMLSDPGAVKQGNATYEHIQSLGLKDGTTLYRCAKCNCIKPDRAHHCSVCGRCVSKMDHHCPWINNCVGENNQKYFILFTMYISFISWHGIAFSAYIFITCSTTGFIGCWYTYTTYVILLTSIVVEGLIFGLFTMIMCFTQLVAICRDETSIEHMKKEVRYKKTSCCDNFRQVFGERFSYRWISPFHSTPPSSIPPPPHNNNNCYQL